jgi:hypothetical protein
MNAMQSSKHTINLEHFISMLMYEIKLFSEC